MTTDIVTSSSSGSDGLDDAGGCLAPSALDEVVDALADVTTTEAATASGAG